jgi:hypothetical protein
MGTQLRGRVLMAGLTMVLGTLVVAQGAMASHPRPKGATPSVIPYVPTFKACPNATVVFPNRTHGPALTAPSCNPPVPESTFLTTFTPTSEGGPGGASNMEASVRLDVVAGTAGDGIDQADFTINGSVTDVRCRQNAAGAPSGQSYACTGNGATGALLGDFAGTLDMVITVRRTDHLNDTTAGGPTWPAPCGYDAAAAPQGSPASCVTASTATVSDQAVHVPVPCAPTPDLGAGADPAGTGDQIGSTCTVATSADALAGPVLLIKDSVRSTVEFIGPGLMNDGGVDGNPFAGPATETPYLRSGIFIP